VCWCWCTNSISHTIYTKFCTPCCIVLVTRWRSWLRHCTTSSKVVGSIPDGVIGIFYWHNPSGHTMALGLTEPLTKMSTRNISWGGKGSRWVGLTTLPRAYASCLEVWEPQPPETLCSVQACNGIAFFAALIILPSDRKLEENFYMASIAVYCIVWKVYLKNFKIPCPFFFAYQNTGW
jgi:hypothetical protein